MFNYQLQHNGYKSIFLQYGFKNNSPYVAKENCSWSKKAPLEVEQESSNTNKFWIGRERLFKWIEFVLREGYVQFGAHMYRQSSGIFMGSSFAPDLANYFAFMHEYTFYLELIVEYDIATRVDNREPMYPLHFILQYGARTKRYIDDIVTIPLACQQGGLQFSEVVFGGTKMYPPSCETYSGMYDKLVYDLDGKLVPTSIDITCEQRGSGVHFLDMEVVQDGSGTTHLKMYDKRDAMATLANYRRFPHSETKCLVNVSIQCYIANCADLRLDARSSYILK